MAEKTITININDADEKAMLHNIVDIDVYIQALVLNKIEGCWRRFRREWTTRLTDDDSFTDDIPVTKTALINLVTARSDYKDREARVAAGEELWL